MDAAGPGAIMRFGMTFSGKDSGQDIMRIYLDGSSVLAVEVALGLACFEPLRSGVNESACAAG